MQKTLFITAAFVAGLASTLHGFDSFDGPVSQRPVPILGAIIWADGMRQADSTAEPAKTTAHADRATYTVRQANFLQEPVSDEVSAGAGLRFHPPLSTEGQPSDRQHLPAGVNLAPEVQEGGSPFHGMPLAVR